MAQAPSFYLTATGAARLLGGPPALFVPRLRMIYDHTGVALTAVREEIGSTAAPHTAA